MRHERHETREMRDKRDMREERQERQERCSCIYPFFSCLQVDRCFVLRYIHTHCNTLQHTATHCNTLQVDRCMVLRYIHRLTHTGLVTFGIGVDMRYKAPRGASRRLLPRRSFWHIPKEGACPHECVAVCCSVLQCVAVCCSVLQCVAVFCSVLQCVAVCCSVLQCIAVCCSAKRGRLPALVLPLPRGLRETQRVRDSESVEEMA